VKKKPEPSAHSKIRHMLFEVLPDDDGFLHHPPDGQIIHAIIQFHKQRDPITGKSNTLEIEWEIPNDSSRQDTK
jgi:hypothetical protein